MVRWSTSGAASIVRQVVIPLGGLGGMIAEARQRSPRELIVWACLLMMGVPAAAAVDVLRERRGIDSSADMPPTSPIEGRSPPSPGSGGRHSC
jgi:hypothetical protein